MASTRISYGNIQPKDVLSHLSSVCSNDLTGCNYQDTDALSIASEMDVDAVSIPISGHLTLNPKCIFAEGNGSQFVDCIVKTAPYGTQVSPLFFRRLSSHFVRQRSADAYHAIPSKPAFSLYLYVRSLHASRSLSPKKNIPPSTKHLPVRNQILEQNQPEPQKPHPQKLRRHRLLLHDVQLHRVRPHRQGQRGPPRQPAGRCLLHRGSGILVRLLQSARLGGEPERCPGAVLWGG